MRLSWKETRSFSDYRWRLFARKELKEKMMIYGFASLVALTGAAFFGYMISLANLALAPIMAILIASDYFRWRGRSYARRKASVNDARIRLSALFWSWSCKREHIEALDIIEKESEDFAGRVIQLETFGGELLEIELPEDQDAAAIRRLLKPR